MKQSRKSCSSCNAKSRQAHALPASLSMRSSPDWMSFEYPVVEVLSNVVEENTAICERQ